MILNKNKNVLGWALLFLICIPFIGVGTGFGYITLSCLFKWQAMKSWEEVPANIVTTSLDTERHTNEGKTSYTYKVTATYTYTYEDKSYTGNKVSMHSGSDNFGSFHKNTYRELSGYKNSGEPFQCYVNPDNPSESILYRAPRLARLSIYLIIMLITCAIGFGLLINAVKETEKKHKIEKIKENCPNEPWLWELKWTEGIINSESTTKLKISLLFAVTFSLASIPILMVIPDELKKGNKPILIALVFPLASVWLVIWAIRNIIAWRKFGTSTFIMETIPGIIGGPLKGNIHTKVNIKPEDGFHLTLSCINRVRTGSGKNRSTHEYVRWQDECEISHEMYEYDPSRSVIPVLFHIPYDSQETYSDEPDNKIIWRLEIKAKVPGVDYETTFEVPVFKTPQSSKDFVLDRSSIASYQAPFNLDSALANEGIQTELLPGGDKRYIFPCARKKMTAFSLLIFILLFTGIAVLFFKSDEPVNVSVIGVSLFKMKAKYIFPVSFGLIDILLIWIFLDILLFHSKVKISKNSINIAKGLFTLSKNQTIYFSNIDDFKIKSCMRSGSKRYYDLSIVTENGKKHLIAKNLPGRQLAENLLKQLENDLLV